MFNLQNLKNKKISESVRELWSDFVTVFVIELATEMACVFAITLLLPIHYAMLTWFVWVFIWWLRSKVNDAFYRLVLDTRFQSEVCGNTFVQTDILKRAIDVQASHAFHDLIHENIKLKEQLKAMQKA